MCHFWSNVQQICHLRCIDFYATPEFNKRAKQYTKKDCRVTLFTRQKDEAIGRSLQKINNIVKRELECLFIKPPQLLSL